MAATFCGGCGRPLQPLVQSPDLVACSNPECSEIHPAHLVRAVNWLATRLAKLETVPAPKDPEPATPAECRVVADAQPEAQP